MTKRPKWEPMDIPPTEEEFAEMARGWAAWETERRLQPDPQTVEWGFNLITKRWFQKVAR